MNLVRIALRLAAMPPSEKMNANKIVHQGIAKECGISDDDAFIATQDAKDLHDAIELLAKPLNRVIRSLGFESGSGHT